MATTPIVRVADLPDFSWNDISYSQPRELASGGKMIYVNFNRQPLIVHTPKMSSSFGVSDYDNDKKFHLDLTFKGLDGNEELKQFKSFLERFDSKLINDGFNNSTAWFKTAYKSKDVVDALFTKTIKGNNEKYAQYFKIKTPYSTEGFQIPVFDQNKNKISIDTPEERAALKGSTITAIIQCTGIWIVDKRFGCNWKVLQMKVSTANRSKIPDYAFGDDDDRKSDSEIDDGSDNEKPDAEDEEDIVSSSEDELEAKPMSTPVKRTTVTKKK